MHPLLPQREELRHSVCLGIPFKHFIFKCHVLLILAFRGHDTLTGFDLFWSALHGWFYYHSLERWVRYIYCFSFGGLAENQRLQRQSQISLQINSECFLY